jgi:hypothetical protein
MKRTLILAAAALLAACASSPGATNQGGPAYAGCWIERQDNGWTTVRWSPIAGGKWQGDWARNTSGDETQTAAFELSTAAAGGQQICGPSDGEQRCFPLTLGAYTPPAANSDANQAYLDASATNLTFALVDDGREELVFRGERNACQ